MAFSDRRFYRLTGSSSATTPTAGDEVDGVALEKPEGDGFWVHFGQGTRIPRRGRRQLHERDRPGDGRARKGCPGH